METTVRPIDLNHLDKSTWKPFRFEQIAERISEPVDPGSTDLETYIGLEHIDSEDIHIRRSGTPSEVSGGKLRCYPGDIIFGKRRAYQRKAAIVEKEAICSAHAFVLRAKPRVIDPMLFPFFLHSDSFMHRMVDISVGGLSPTINWGDLKHQEFLLPPKDEQARLAELLWAMDEVVEAKGRNFEKFKSLFHAEVFHFFKNRGADGPRLGDVSDVSYGLTLNSTRNMMEFQAPYLRVANVKRGFIDFSEIKNVGCTVDEINSFKLEKDDLLVVEGHADINEIGRAAIWPGQSEPVLHQNHLLKIRGCTHLSPVVLEAFINSVFGRNYFICHAKSTTGLNTINSTVLKNLKIPAIDKREQKVFIERKMALDSQLTSLEENLNLTRALQKSLINQIF